MQTQEQYIGEAFIGPSVDLFKIVEQKAQQIDLPGPHTLKIALLINILHGMYNEAMLHTNQPGLTVLALSIQPELLQHRDIFIGAMKECLIDDERTQQN